jgi:hypothetical protein
MAHCTRCYYQYFINVRIWIEHRTVTSLKAAEPVFVNVYGAQESIPRNRFLVSGIVSPQ